MRILLITLDDLNLYNCGYANMSTETKSINELSKTSHNFWNAHCNVPFCQPSRSVLMTGLYPQNNGSFSFTPINRVPNISSILKRIGYRTVLIGKVSHYKPFDVYNWDQIYDIKNISEIEKCLQAENIFDNSLLSINLHYPHRPFVNSSEREVYFPERMIYNSEIKKQLSQFEQTLIHADKIVSVILNNTVPEDFVVLTSDHGASFPFFKGNCYGSSTNIPMMIRHKEIAAFQDKESVISHVDFLPTVCDFLGIKDVKFDGHSYLKTIKYKSKFDKNHVYVQLNKMMFGPNCRIRAATNKTHSYIINIDQEYCANFVDGWGWSDVIDDLEPSFFFRQPEEFVENNKLDFKQDNNKQMMKTLKNALVQTMLIYKDPQYRNALMSVLKFA